MDVKFSKIEDLKELITNTITKKLKETLLIQEGFYDTSNVLDEIEKTEVKPEYIAPKLEEVTLNFAVHDDDKVYLDAGVKEENKVSFDNREELIPVHEVTIKPIKPIGACHGTYIIGENEDGIYIIDQHAAAERINYEKCYKAILSHSKNIQDLLIPITIELPNNEYIILKKHFDILDRLGFIYEEFGINTIVIRSHPVWLPEYALEEAIRKIIDIIITEEDFSELKFSDRVSMTMACKMSIKGNDAITIPDMEYLLNKLIQTDNPYTCPHGRPTIIKYTKYDLEKMFKRALD
jgi:DNA mismatch repair protein MutL